MILGLWGATLILRTRKLLENALNLERIFNNLPIQFVVTVII